MPILYTIDCQDIHLEFKDGHETHIQQNDHYHDGTEIMFFVRAHMSYFSEARRYIISDGDLLFIKEYELHRPVYRHDQPYVRYVLHTNREFLLRTLRASDIEHLLPNLQQLDNKRAKTTLEQREELRLLFHRLYCTQIKAAPENQALDKALVKSTMVLILIRLYSLLTAQPEAILSAKERHVQEILSYLDANFEKTITLGSLEKRFSLNQHYISHIVKEISGFSVLDHIQHKRVAKAQSLLAESAEDITSICYECGFHNLQHFYRVFKKLALVTPGQFRNTTTVSRHAHNTSDEECTQK